MPETTQAFQPVFEERTFIAERLARAEPSREQVMFNVANILCRELSVTLQYDWETEQKVELTKAGVSKWLANLDELSESDPDCVYGLLDHPSTTKVIFYWRQVPSRHPQREELHCRISHDISLEPLLKIFSEVSPYFQADYSYMYNLTLRNLHGRAMRAYEEALARRPPEEHHSILKPDPYNGVTDNLPPLLFGDEFDRLRVPDGVWWINYWSPLQVETVGIDRIRTANWARLIELPNGGMTLAATEDAFDVTNPAHMARLGEIVEHLQLRQLQEHYRIQRA
jgi:hypothetical protein